jgi:hypothetical protein
LTSFRHCHPAASRGVVAGNVVVLQDLDAFGVERATHLARPMGALGRPQGVRHAGAASNRVQGAPEPDSGCTSRRLL